MDHRMNRRSVQWMMPAMLGVGVLLAGLLQTPLSAQSERPEDTTDGGAVPVRTTHYSHPQRATGGDAASGVGRPGQNSDDPETQPLSAFQKSSPPAPAEDTGSLALTVLGKLGLVVALMIAGAAVWKRFRGVTSMSVVSGGQSLQVASSVALGPQRFLHLVTVGHHQLLVGSSAQTVSLIAVLEGGASAATAGSAAAAAPPETHRSALESEGAAKPPVEPPDQFEELLLRMRELETGLLMREPNRRRDAAGSGAEADGMRWEPARSGHAPRAESERSSAARSPTAHLEAGLDPEADRALAPGALFRTSRAPVGGSPDA